VAGTDSRGGFGLRNASTVWRQVATADGPLVPGTDSGIRRIGPGGWFRGKIELIFRRIFQGIYPLEATILGRCNGTDDSILFDPHMAPSDSTEIWDWGSLFDQHQRWLLTIVRARLADPHAAADVLQEVALAAISQPNRPETQDKIAPWLYRIALRKIVNHHRASGRRRKLLLSASQQDASGRAEDSMSPCSWVLMTETQASVRKGLEKLHPQDRQLLLLKYTEGWGYEQLASHLGVSVKTIEYRLLKARRALRSVLADRGLCD